MKMKKPNLKQISVVVRIILSLWFMYIVYKNSHWSVSLFIAIQMVTNEVLVKWVERINKFLGIEG